jgi:hypothetical protein
MNNSAFNQLEGKVGWEMFRGCVYRPCVQVLVEQCRRLGIDVEASSAHLAHMAQASRGGGAGGTGAGGRKPAWNLDISAIHARIKQVPACAAPACAHVLSCAAIFPCMGCRHLPLLPLDALALGK